MSPPKAATEGDRIVTTQRQMPRFWIDLINPSDVHFFAAIVAGLRGKGEAMFTTRRKERGEVSSLARDYGLEFRQVGEDHPNRLRKRLDALWRVLLLSMTLDSFDCALSFENFMSVLTAAIRRTRSVVYLDNDLSLGDPKLVTARWLKRIEARATRVIVPAAFDIERFSRIGGCHERVFTYEGCKEQVYVADFKPNPAFPARIPFDRYVVVRPEALFAVYVKERQSLVPELISELESAGYNVVFVPRIQADLKLAEATSAYIPPRPLPGLDLCWHASAVLTGSGTLGREAACMGVPAVSFFPEDRLLSVDSMLIRKGALFHSHNVRAIIQYLTTEIGRPRARAIQISAATREEVVRLTLDALST